MDVKQDNISTKNFRNSGYDRVALDHYPTPDGFTETLMNKFEKYIPKHYVIWEPCTGPNKQIEKVIQSYGYKTIGTDIFFDETQDVFNYTRETAPSNIVITNPPYGLYEDYEENGKTKRRNLDTKYLEKLVRHLIEITDCVILLLRNDWDSAGTRSDLFSTSSPFYGKIAVNERFKWIGDSKNGGQHNHSWFIWMRNAKGHRPILDYGPNCEEWNDE